MSILVVQFVKGSEETTTELLYSEFVRQVESDNVLKVTVYDGERIEGELRNSITLEDATIHTFHTRTPGEISEALKGELLDRNVDVSAKAEATGWGTLLFGLLPWLLFIAFWIWIFRTMQSGGNKAFQFGRSRAKLISPDTPKVTFADVAGADEAKQELEEIIEFLKDPPRFSRLGGRLPKGVLLVGPPGTGKTLLARAVAGEAGRPFFQMSGSDFVEMFVGVGASRVRDLFEQGKAHAPCIIFVDEIDAVGRHRGAGLGGGHDEREQTLNALLVEMDGFEANEGVILLGGHQPTGRAGSGVAQARSVRPSGRGGPPGREGPRRHPQSARQEAPVGGTRRPERHRPRYAGPERRGPLEYLQRSRVVRRASRGRPGHDGGLRGGQGQGHARHGAPKHGADRSRAAAHGVPRSRSCRDRG